MLSTVIKAIWITWVTLVCLHACSALQRPWGEWYNVAYGAEMEISGDYGWPITKGAWKSTNSTVSISINSRQSPRLLIGLEADFSHLAFKEGHQNEDATVISICPILKYDFIKLKSMKFYGTLGAGVGFRNDSPSENVLGHNPLGAIKAGLGAEFYLTNKITFDLGIKYNHLSSHNPGDKGVNHLGPRMGLTWRF